MQTARRAQIEQALLKGTPYKEIASEYRVSFRDITRIAKEIREPSPLDVFSMVVLKKTPMDIAEKTGAEFGEVKKIYEECVELLELAQRHSEAIDKLKGTELYKRLTALAREREGEDAEERELLAKSVIGAKYECAGCGAPLKEEDVRNLRPCSKCGRTTYREER